MTGLSIKGLIVAVFAFILALALGATASLLYTDHLTREALARHQAAMEAAAPEAAHAPELVASYRALRETVAGGTRVTLIMRVGAFLIGLALALLVYRRVARLVATTAAFAGRIEGGDLAVRFVADSVGETAALAAALNRMVERLEAALASEAEASRRLAFLVSATPAVIYAARPTGDHGLTYISPNVLEQMGHAPRAFLDQPGFWLGHVHAEDAENVLRELARLPQTGRAECEYRFEDGHGAWRWLHAEMALVREASGEPREVVGSWLDITARKGLEASLARRDAILNAVAYAASRFLHAGEEASEGTWRLTVEAVLSHLGEAAAVSRIWIGENVTDETGELRRRIAHRWAAPQFAVAENEAVLAELRSYRAEGTAVEALRLRRGELLQLRPADLPAAVAERFRRLEIRSQLLAPIMKEHDWWGFIAFDDCVAERAWSELELEAIRTLAGLVGSALSARGGREALRASLETLGSVLEKVKRQSAEIQRQNEALLQANRMKSEFLAAVTHELRTPLHGILGFAELLQNDATLNATQASYVGEVMGAAAALQHLVERLLELARIEAGKVDFRPQEVDLGALLQDAARSFAPAAQKGGVSLEAATSPQAVVVEGDARLLRRLVDELIDNAIKFNTPGGKVSLVVRLAEPAGRTAAEVALLEVCDTGIGIAAEEQGRLFQPFVQLDAALTRRFGGTGLGLALARRIAELHHAELKVKSQPGAGSCFTLSLPTKHQLTQ